MTGKVLSLKERRRIAKVAKAREQRRRIYNNLKEKDLTIANLQWENLKINEKEIIDNIHTMNNEVAALCAEQILIDNLGEDEVEFNEHKETIQNKLVELTDQIEALIEKKGDRIGLVSTKAELLDYEYFIEQYVELSREILDLNMLHVNQIVLIATQVRNRLIKQEGKKDD